MRRTVIWSLGVLSVLTAYAVGDVYDMVPGVVTLQEYAAAPTSGTAPDQEDGVGPAVLPAAADAPMPSTPGLAKALAAPSRDPALGGSVAIDIRDATTGQPLYAVGADLPRVPASTAKLLTAAAIVQAGAPAREGRSDEPESGDGTPSDLQERIATTAVRGATRDQVILRAGGDLLLAPGRGNPGAVLGRAGLADLAGQVATTMKRDGMTSVSLALDESFAAGPRLAPGWEQADVDLGLTGPIAMIGLASERPEPGKPVPADPGASVAEAFRTALTGAGITVRPGLTRITGAAGSSTDGSTAASAASPAATTGNSAEEELGRVESAALLDVLGYALDMSDNALTESLARRAAYQAGAGTDVAQVATWVRSQVGTMGLSTDGLTLADASGLSAGSTVPVRTLSDLLVLALGPDRRWPDLAILVQELPVSGYDGTLFDRYLSRPQRLGAGMVRAKTGTLTGVSGLAGTVLTRDGRVLAVAVIADRIPAGGTSAGRAALDRLMTALAGCGCA